jgi:class 3 adenylate cyclase
LLCDSCGAAVGPTARFCEQCGSPIAAGAAAVPDRSASTRPGPEGDRRVVTALFADIVDYVRMVAELDPELVQARIAAALGAMGEHVERLGGTREKFIGDAIFAVFGWPVARDDDAVRAALCGLSIRSTLGELPGGEPLEVRIGISTGEVAALSGGGVLDENRLTGPAIVTAARLQSLARSGEILVDQATVEAARDRIGVTDRGDVVLRGHPGSVHVYAVERESGFETWAVPRPAAGPLVGRVEELAALVGAIDSCRATGHGSTVLLEGEAGIGKSRLLGEAEAVARQAGLNWTWTENVSYGGVEPYRFARVLAQALADEHGTDSGTFARRMLFTLDMDPITAQRFGGAIAAIAREAQFTGWEAEARHMPDDPAEVATVLGEVAERYVGRLLETSGPRVIVIDDLHWIDQSSVAMVELLVERTKALPLVILSAMRPGPPPPWSGRDHVRRIRLAGLREAESGQLATNVARAALDADDARVIHERTGGNPLFVSETVRAFLTDGTLSVRNGRLTLAAGADHALPITLRAVLGARIDALSPDARELLGIASVIGIRFRSDMAAGLVGRPLDPAVLQELVDGALIRRADVDRWRFAHPLIRDAAYSGLLASRRRELHGRYAEQLESLRPAPPIAWIARHRAAAGDRDRALPLLEEAAVSAMAMGAATEAAAFWREAAELSDDPAVADGYRLRAAEVTAGASRVTSA